MAQKKRANKTTRSRKRKGGKKKSGGNKAYYFQNRNTPVIAPDAKTAKKRKRRPKSDKIVSVRKAQKGEGAGKGKKSGRWSTIRRDGKTKAKSKYGKGRGQGPPRRSKK